MEGIGELVNTLHKARISLFYPDGEKDVAFVFIESSLKTFLEGCG